MKHYYLVPQDVAEISARHFAFSHWIDIDGTNVLLSGVHRDARSKGQFELNVVAEALPLEYESTPLEDKHVQKLAAKLGTKKGHTMKDVLAAARQIHPQL